MRNEVAVVCSRSDPASINVADQLMRLESWEDHGGYSSSGPFRLVVHSERQTALKGLDSTLARLGLSPQMVVFPCRHESKERLPWFGGHFTGKLDEGHRELSAAAPWGLRSFLWNIKKLAPAGYRVSAEATHHGPTDMQTPSFFAEIGSSEQQWSDPDAGEVVARAILGLDPIELPVFLGFGGGHYVQRQTELIYQTEISFGHLFSSYQLGSLDSELVDEARRKSCANYAYVDLKSLRSEEKNMVRAILDELAIPLMKGKEIRARFPVEEQTDPNLGI
jgi:D-aminoacyl-tRNA deacylase